MDAVTTLLLVCAGLAGGIITAVVGGSSLLVFPVMLAAGLPPILANTSSTVAMTPISLAAALADRERIPPWDRSFLGLLVVSVLGTVTGSLLLLFTPQAAFMAVVPLLVGAATALFAFSDRIKRAIARRAAASANGARTHTVVQLWMVAAIAVYGGYFGAAMSVMLLAALALGHEGDFRTINTIKNILSALVGAIAATIFISQGAVGWPQALAVMLGALVGGYLGGKLVRVLPSVLLRWIVIVVGAGLATYYAWRYWRV
ncbi:MAG: sulfite exporter TauE/SafE family protein [Alphaproteobacteria bacterium]|nr:sulfite exporter TauE/SafE family protein [Alphaproteobacteria bacterium]